MGALFGRRAKLILGVPGATGVEIESDGGPQSLRITFRCEKTTAPLDPNALEVTIHNLNADTRGRLDGDKTPRVKTVLQAGYGEDIGAVFIGESVSIGHVRTKTGWETTIRAGDMQRLRHMTINESFGAGAKGGDVLQKILDAVANQLGLDVKEAVKQAKAGQVKEAIQTFKRGLTLSGSADQSISKVLAGTGYTMILADDEVHILARDETLPREAVVLSQETGLIGSPQIARDQVLTVVGQNRAAAKPGKLDPGNSGLAVIKATALLSARIMPRALVRLESSTVSCDVRVTRTLTTGDTHGQEWTTELEGTNISKEAT